MTRNIELMRRQVRGQVWDQLWQQLLDRASYETERTVRYLAQYQIDNLVGNNLENMVWGQFLDEDYD